MSSRWKSAVGEIVFDPQSFDFIQQYQEKGLDTTHLFVDYSYKAFMKDPIGTTKDIYSKLQMPWTDEVEAKFRTYMSGNQQGKYGPHSYTLEEYGLSEEYMHRMWKPYCDYFKEYL